MVSLLLLGVGLTFGVLYFSRFDGGPRIVDDYYRRGVAWDSLAAVAGRIERLGWTVDVDVSPRPDSEGRSVVRAVVRDSTGTGVAGLGLTVSAFRPTDTQPAATVVAADSAGGVYVAGVELPLAGLWDFEVAGTALGEPFLVRVRRDIAR